MSKTFNLILLISVIVISAFVEPWLWNKWRNYEPDIASLDEQLVGLPVIADEEALVSALGKSPEKYILSKLPVFGKEVADTMDIFAEDHLAMVYLPWRLEHLHNANATPGHRYRYEWMPSDTVLNTKALQVKFFNKYALDWSDADLIAAHSNVEGVDVKGHNRINYKTPFYQPVFWSKLRYQIFKLDNGDAVSLVAMVGNDRIDIAEVSGKKRVAIGAISELVYNDSLGEQLKSFMWLGAFAVVGVLALIAVVYLLAKLVLKSKGIDF